MIITELNEIKANACNELGLECMKYKNDNASYNIALAHFETACTLQPNISEFHMNRARALIKLECINEAHLVFDRILAIDPNCKQARLHKSFAI